jgi:hypothetical protein
LDEKAKMAPVLQSQRQPVGGLKNKSPGWRSFAANFVFLASVDSTMALLRQPRLSGTYHFQVHAGSIACGSFCVFLVSYSPPPASWQHMLARKNSGFPCFFQTLSSLLWIVSVEHACAVGRLGLLFISKLRR